MPTACYQSRSYYPNGTIEYFPDWNPFIYFQYVDNNAVECDSHDVNFVVLNQDITANTLPTYIFISFN